MRARTLTRIALAVFAASAAAHPNPASADFVLTVTGTFQSFYNETERFDGTNYYTNDLPPLFDVDRLRGGTFSANFRFPDVTSIPNGNFADYNFAAPAGLGYTLYDASGAVVDVGSSSSDPFARVFNNFVFTNSSNPPFDEVAFFAFVNDVTGLRIPTTRYGTDQALYAIQSGIFFSGDGSGSNDYILQNLGIPTDLATYLSFPNKFFTTGLEYDDGDVFGDTPYQTISTFLSYGITGVKLSAVPEPGSAVLVAIGGAILAGAGWSRRRRVV